MMNKEDSLSEYNQRITDRYLQTLYSLWNALIIFNTLLIGAIAILLAINPSVPKIIVFFIFFSGSLSIVLLLWNYLRLKWMYIDLQRLVEYYEKLTLEECEEKKKKDLAKALRVYKWIGYREYTAIAFAIIDLAMISIFLIIPAVV